MAYEFPGLDTGDDANWVSGEVELTSLRAGRFVARVPVSLHTEELANFAALLRRLDAELSGEATLEHLESQLGATIKLQAGGGTLAAFVRVHVEAELRVEEVRIDQSYVRQALVEFDVLSNAFPIRGTAF
jgi:hypothetical protein